MKFVDNYFQMKLNFARNHVISAENQREKSYADQKKIHIVHTGKSSSEALIFASTNPQYDNRLFIALRVQYMKITS